MSIRHKNVTGLALFGVLKPSALRVGRFGSIGALVLCVQSCGLFKDSETERKTPSPAEEFPGVEKHSVGLTFIVRPFERGDEPNVYVHLPESVYAGGQKPLLMPPQTVPGFHWAWTGQTPQRIGLARMDDAKWGEFDISWDTKSGSEAQIPEGMRLLRYRMDFSKASVFRDWPAVVGGLDAKSGTLTLHTFLYVVPPKLQLPVRIYFQKDFKPLQVAGHFTSCGAGCVEFSNFIEAFDSPMGVAIDAQSLQTVGEKDKGVRFLLAGNLSTQTQSISLALVEDVRKSVQAIWEFLNTSWGEVAASKNYVFHLVQTNDCNFQGLEHFKSSLLALGVNCDSTQHKVNLLRLATHEMIHVWNAKHVYPKETAQFDAAAFSKDRLKQLYFYEGFTEGFARIALAQFTKNEMNFAKRLSLWNESLGRLFDKMVGQGHTPESLSVADPYGAYHLGGVMALRLATLARKVHGAAEAKQKYWGFFRELVAGAGTGRAFLLNDPIWAHVSFANFVAKTTQQVSTGYTKSDLLQACELALGTQVKSEFEAAFFSENPPAFSSMSALNNLVAEMAKESGLALKETLPSGKWDFSIVTTPEDKVETWPL